MALKDLCSYLRKNNVVVRQPCQDAIIASNVLDLLFNQVNDCLNRDRSDVKLNKLEKGVVSTGLGRVLPGTRDFILGMYAEELNTLLDSIEKELVKRNKNLSMSNILYENMMLRKELDELKHQQQQIKGGLKTQVGTVKDNERNKESKVSA